MTDRKADDNGDNIDTTLVNRLVWMAKIENFSAPTALCNTILSESCIGHDIYVDLFNMVQTRIGLLSVL